MEVESFQRLTMAEKLHLWKQKTQVIQQVPVKDTRSPPSESASSSTSAMLTAIAAARMDASQKVSVSSLLTKDTDHQDRRRSFVTTSRGRENSTKRKTLWGIPSSPLLGSFDEHATSPVTAPKDSPVSKSPFMKIRLIEDQNCDPNIVNIENATQNVSGRSMDYDEIEFGMSPMQHSLSKHTPSSLYQRSKRGTPASLQTRDSTGYYTANESIDEERNEFNAIIFDSTSDGKLSGNRTSDSFRSQRDSIDKSKSSKFLKMMALETALASALQEVERLKLDVSGLCKEKMIYAVKVHSLSEQKKDFELKLESSCQDVQAQVFLNSVLEQKVDELNYQISNDRLFKNEQMSSKTKKYKAEIEKMTDEKMMYEERANAMCIQMGEQMTLLQSTAMGRIEDLEKELFEERRRSESFESQLRHLKLSTTIKQMKNRKSDSSDDTEEDDTSTEVAQKNNSTPPSKK